jgi:hypothetical protein
MYVVSESETPRIAKEGREYGGNKCDERDEEVGNSQFRLRRSMAEVLKQTAALPHYSRVSVEGVRQAGKSLDLDLMPGAAKHEGRQRYAIWQLASRDQCWLRWLNEMSTPKRSPASRRPVGVVASLFWKSNLVRLGQKGYRNRLGDSVFILPILRILRATHWRLGWPSVRQ